MICSLTKGNVLVEFVDLGEGWVGDYDPDDPYDESLLRFDVSLVDPSNMSYIPVDDASYCTRIPVDTDVETLSTLLGIIMGEVYEPLQEGHSIKKICERLSWIDLEGTY